MRTNHPTLRSVLAAAAAAIACASATAEPYVINALPNPGSITAPSINNQGSVGFVATLDANTRGIVVSDGGPFRTLVDTRGPISGFLGLPVPLPLSDAGSMPFRGTLASGGEGIFVAHANGTIGTIASTAAGQFRSFDSLPGINASGTVVFAAQRTDGSSGVFASNGSTITTIADTRGGAFTGFPALSTTVNDRADVAFRATLAGGGEAIFVGNGGEPRLIADTRGEFASFRSPGMSINDQGLVAFAAELRQGGSAIFVGDGSVLTEITRSAGRVTNVFLPSINDADAVSFYATLVGDGNAVFAYTPGIGIESVVQSGDALLGSIVAAGPTQNRGAFTSIYSLNDLGQVGIWFRLLDGRQLVGVATPSRVALPPTAGLVALGLAALGASRLRRGLRS